MVDLTKAYELAEAACYPLSSGPVEAGCIDGRYHEVRRPLRRPGANAGEVLDAIRALRELIATFEPIACWDAVVKSVGGEKHFHWHSDTNTGCVYSGCGHVLSTTRSPRDYGLEPGDTQFLCRKLHELWARGTNPLRLQGQHREHAVFMVESNTHAMFSQACGAHFFVFHRTLNGRRLDEIAGHLHPRIKENHGITQAQVAQALKRAANANLHMTLAKVAANLPRFRVNIGPSGSINVDSMMP